MSNTVSFWKGESNEVAFVLSCPGRVEKESGKLVSGTTGKNLDALLVFICNDENVDKNLFFSTDRYKYRITNASNIIHFKSNGNGTEPSCSEIRNGANIIRLVNELKGFKIIITFGHKAKSSLFLCRGKLSDSKIINVRHIGMQSLNGIKSDEMGDPIDNANNNKTKGRENTHKRIKVVAKDILMELHL